MALNKRSSASENYAKKLRDPRWQKKRLEVFQRDNFCCQNCGDKEATLHVHHKVYGHRDPWDSPLHHLITLCEPCHEEETFDRAEMEQELLKVLRKALNLDQLGYIFDFYNNQNRYFDFLSDERWLERERTILKDNSTCFICNAKDNLVIYHKSPSSVSKKPWELPDDEFDSICKSCNRINNGPYINLIDYLEFLTPAFHHAGYYSDDVVDLVTDGHLNKFIRLVLEEIRKERLSRIPDQFLDHWSLRKNITCGQLVQLYEEEKLSKNKIIALDQNKKHNNKFSP